MRVTWLLSLALVLLACATTHPTRRRARRRRARTVAARLVTSPTVPPRVTAATPASTPPSVASRTSTPTHRDARCDEITHRNAEVIARIASIDACEAAVVPLLRETFGACVGTSEANWAPVLVSVQPRGDEVCNLTVQWRVTLLRRGAAIEEREQSTGRVARSFRVLADGDAVQQVAQLTFGAADYDRDRVPELVVTEVVEDHGVGETRSAVEVYTGVGGEVTVFDATRTMPIVATTDIDDDGRPDLVLRANYTWSEGAECGIDLAHWPVTQLAHALPNGGLALDDAFAAQYLRQMCPGPDAPAIVPRGVDADEAEGLGIVCRRLWGASAQDALAPLECRSFRSAPSARCMSSTRRLAPLAADECPEHYQRWATAQVPLRLR